MKTNFYDIESLDNVFTLCNYKHEDNTIDIFYLCDSPQILSGPINLHELLLQRILDRNHNFNGNIALFDLHEKDANLHLIKTFGLSDARLVNDKTQTSSYPDEFRLVCDTDPEYDPDLHPYLFGYNSYNYDTTMLALYEYDIFTPRIINAELNNATHELKFSPVTAHKMREYNDDLFSSEFKPNMPTYLARHKDPTTNKFRASDYSDPRWKIRKSMLMSGRHLDVARLNEKQQKVGLKRLLGMLGLQILESDKLGQGQDTIYNLDQFLELIAYNVSDCVNLQKLFSHKFYQGQFSLKKGLLETYPELIYEKLPNAYKPDIRPERVRRDRLTIDTSSAQFATKCLCPYDHLHDIKTVSFMYPSEVKSQELGIPRVNVLEESRKFFYDLFPQPELRARFDKIYNYYKTIEGKNFNFSENYKADFENDPEYAYPVNLNTIPKVDTCLPYFNADGTPSSCFVTFSTGGVHGAEYNKVLFESDTKAFEALLADFDYVKSQYPDPIDLKKAKKITMPDGRELKATDFLKSGSTMTKASYKDIEKKRPVLFKLKDDGSTELNKDYVYTSADPTNHEDFTSYYPNMLRMLSAFYNTGLGYDRYAEIFDNKQKYGKLMKDKSRPEPEREKYSVLREGTKLILNSASGAGDANFESNVRMNNQIISMRIIGQLFTWRIGQAQTYQGAKITSTNTDGLYSVLDPAINNPILEKESKDINVEIEPEPTYLISKDSNNRIEFDEATGEIESASGGTLACRKGPNPTKALAHSAATDWAMTEYLIMAAFKYKDASLSLPFSNTIGMNILKSMESKFDDIKFLNLFQNIIASSTGSISYIFGTTDADPSTPIIMQHYNRVFILKDNTPNCVHLQTACAKAITPAMKATRAKAGYRPVQHDNTAMNILKAHGVGPSDIGLDKEATIKKVTNIEPEWYMFVQNKALSDLTPEEIKFIKDNLDYDKYLLLLRKCFEKNWMNTMPKDILAAEYAATDVYRNQATTA